MFLRSYDVAVIGAGASGCMAAISAAKEGKSVIIVEHLDRIGKKILSTGNGKCNYTNRAQGTSFYRGEDPAFVVPVFKQFGFEETIGFFKELGIHPKEKNGYFYPYSEQAASVVEVLELALKKYKVEILLNTELETITYKNGYRIRTTHGAFASKSLIFATGLRAGRKSGCDGSAFPYIEAMGHHFIDVVPALVQMKSGESFLKNLAGIRAEIGLKLLVDGMEIFEDFGELLHIDGGLSGIVSFQASRYAAYGCKSHKKVEAVIDYYPKGTIEELEKILMERFYVIGVEKNALEAMVGFFPYKLCQNWFKLVGIHPDESAEKVARERIKSLSKIMKACTLQIDGTKTFEDAQVCAGGVSTKEVHNDTLESKFVPQLFFCGEVLDIDGMCGGYNLQWAWSSGYVAGHFAAR